MGGQGAQGTHNLVGKESETQLARIRDIFLNSMPLAGELLKSKHHGERECVRAHAPASHQGCAQQVLRVGGPEMKNLIPTTVTKFVESKILFCRENYTEKDYKSSEPPS